MSSAEFIRTEQEIIPDWAPVVSADSNLYPWLESIDLDYEEIASLVEDEGVSRQELQKLWIHLSEYPCHHLLGLKESSGIFVSSGLINQPGNKRYRMGIGKLLTKQASTDLDFRGYSFVLLDIPAIITTTRSGGKPLEEIKNTLIHELLHFTEDIKWAEWWTTATWEDKRRANLAAAFTESEEEIVVARENEIHQAKKYGRILTASSDVVPKSRMLNK